MSDDRQNPRDNPDAGRFDGDDQHGWAPDVDAEPGQRTEGGNKAFNADNAGNPGPGREPSDEERDGVPPTDTTAATPLGVGESINRRGEDISDHDGKEDGRIDQGSEGQAQRPAGTSTAENVTGVDPQESQSGTPTMQPGDQGG